MSDNTTKKSRWLYVSLGIMLFALVSFSILPLVVSIFQANQSSISPLSSPQQQLEMTALGYQMVIEREPENVNALEGLLETRLKQGNLQGLIAPLESLAQLNPQKTDYGILLAQTQQYLQDYEGAATSYRTLLASHPEDIRALKGMTDLLVLQNRSPEAIALIQNTLKEATNTNSNLSEKASKIDLVSVQLLLGEIYLSQNQENDALNVYEQAIKSSPQDFRPLLAKALILQKQGKKQDAQSLFQEAISLSPVQYKDQIKLLATETKTSQKASDS